MSHMRCAGLFLFALLGCFEHNDALTPPLVQNTARLESDVLSLVIADVSHRFKRTVQILPINITQFGMAEDKAALEIVDDSVPPLDREAIADFRHRNADSGSMRMPLQLRIPYRWITDEELRKAGDHPDEPRVDGPVVGLSHVGFSRDYRAAFVYVTYNCGALCGAGNFVRLQRDAANVWHITQRRLAWVS